MAIVASNLSFAYPKNDILAVSDVSVSFASGEVSALSGPNGCGKTTLIKLIVGILKMQKGEVFIDEQITKGLTLTEIGRKVGFVMQQPERQLFCTSVREEMEFGLINMGLDSTQIKEKKDKYLEYFGLSQYKEKFPFELSTGEKQRLVIAAVMAMEPKYLILDEPTSSLDVLKRKELGALIRDVAEKEKIGVVIITHDEKFVSKYADKCLLMEKGQIAT